MLATLGAPELLARLDEFGSSTVDVRSPSEFADDRVPGAVNWPVLDDEERRQVGTEYAQVSPFAAKKRGAALVARNIASHIENEVIDKPKDWQPLVYCWRGGTRSKSLAIVLDQIGFRVHCLEGGYQAYRRAVLAALETLPNRYHYRVVCGTTGSGKSRFLRRLAADGAQILDLEALANHRGSVLGLVPGDRQPGQKEFESRVWDALRRLDPARPVYVESESRKVGDLRVPPAVIGQMHVSPCIRLELELEARVALLLDEYDFFVHDIAAFCARLDALRASRGHALVNGWQEAARAGDVAQVVRALLELHYDPNYRMSMKGNFAGSEAPLRTLQWDGTATALADAAARALAAG